MLRIKDFLTLALIVPILASCGVSQQDKEEIATITCNIIKSSRNMDAALRIKEINLAREQIGEERFLGTDDDIKEALSLSLCELLVMNDASYETVRNTKLAAIAEIKRQKEEKERLERERERLERERIAAEQREKARLERERKAAELRKKEEKERLERERKAAELRKKEEEERKLISNIYENYEQLKKNRPVDFTLELLSVTNTGAILIGDGQSYFVTKDDEIKDWNVKIVYTSNDTKSVVLQDIRNNNLFLISLN